MREQLTKKNNVGCEYTSHVKYSEDRFKHTRMRNELEDKYKVPMTFN